jgi:hypothetical protein
MDVPIEEIDISDSMHLIAVDSQWYIEDWDGIPNLMMIAKSKPELNS